MVEYANCWTNPQGIGGGKSRGVGTGVSGLIGMIQGEGATLSPIMKETAVRKSFQKLKQTRWNKTVSLVLADYAISQVCFPRMHMLGYRDPEWTAAKIFSDWEIEKNILEEKFKYICRWTGDCLVRAQRRKATNVLLMVSTCTQLWQSSYHK